MMRASSTEVDSSVIISIPSNQTTIELIEQDRPYLLSNKTLPSYSTSTTDSNTTLLPPTYDSIKSFSIIAPSLISYSYSIKSTITTLLTSTIYLIYFYFHQQQQINSTILMRSSMKIFLTVLIIILISSNLIGLLSGGNLLLDLNPKCLFKNKWEIRFGTFLSALSMWIIVWISFLQSQVLVRVYAFLVLITVQAIIFEHLSHTATVTDLERRLKLSENRLRALI